MSKSTAIATREERAPAPVSVFSSMEAFENAKSMCGALVNSGLVPQDYRGNGNMGNAMIALDMANRMGIAPIMVMQNLDIIEGRPSWKSQFIIAAINSCGLFSPLRFDVVDHGEKEVTFETWGQERGQKVRKTIKVRNLECRATAIEKKTGEVLSGPPVSMETAIGEGWYQRKGSKWQTMPELMLRYRAAAFFGRLYAPHILNGMPTADETIEIEAEYHEMPRVDPGAGDAPADPERKPGRARGLDAALKRAEPSKAAEAEADPAEEKGRAPARRQRQAEPDRRQRKADPDPEPEDADFTEEEGRLDDDPGHDGEGGDGLPFGEPGEDDDEPYRPA